MNPARATLAATLATAAVLTACGSGREHTAADSTQLRGDMQAVAAAAHAGGALDDGQLAAIRSALATVQADLTAATSRPPATITASPTPRPTKAPPDKHKGGHGHDGGGEGGD